MRTEDKLTGNLALGYRAPKRPAIRVALGHLSVNHLHVLGLPEWVQSMNRAKRPQDIPAGEETQESAWSMVRRKAGSLADGANRSGTQLENSRKQERVLTFPN